MAIDTSSLTIIIDGGDVVLPDRVVQAGTVVVVSGKIEYAGPPEHLPERYRSGARRIAAPSALVCPALWEPHLHGCGGFSTEDMTAEAIVGMAGFLAQRGVGAFVPTTVPVEDYLHGLGRSLSSPEARRALEGRVPGIHVEGPFVAASKRGGIPEELVQPVSPERLQRLLAVTESHIRVLTFAPELTATDWLHGRLRELSILPSLGHSDARYSDLSPYDETAPLGVTHLFNGMSGVSHKEPGLAHWALLNRWVSTELICDGTHVQDPALQLAIRSRPAERVVLVSDAIGPAGVSEASGSGGSTPGPAPKPPRLYGKPLEPKGAGFYYADSGTLVGSNLLVKDGLARLIGSGMVSVPRAVAMATLNPARFFGYTRKGALLPGYDGDVAVFSRDFRHCDLLTWQGRVIHERRP